MTTKVVILCGGYGTRIRDVADDIPKPLIPIGSAPILWHIMKYYSSWGFNDFILCLGYRGSQIKDFFMNYQSRISDFTLTLNGDSIEYHREHDETPWRVTLADTGLHSLTGTRLRMIRKYLDDGEFMLTYGDGVSDVDIRALLEFHRANDGIMTVTGVRPPGRFGELEVESSGYVTAFNEKPQAMGGMISGGFFVCSSSLFDYLPDEDNVMLERGPMQEILRDGKLRVFRHDGFWQCMDTQRDFRLLNEMIETDNAPWIKW